MTSQLTGLRVRTTSAVHKSQLTGLRVRNLSGAGHSQMSKLRVQNVAGTHLGESQLTGLRVRNVSNSAALAVLSGPTAGLEPTDPFTLTLAGSLGGPFSSTAITLVSGPTPVDFSVVAGVATGKAPFVKPLVAGYPNDVAPAMVFKGTVTNGAGTAETTITIPVFPHLTWDAAGNPLIWHLA